MTNPFAPPAPTQPTAPPANPFGQPATSTTAAPAQPAWLATPTAQEQATFPAPHTSMPAAAAAGGYTPPVLGQVGSVAPPAPSGGDGADLWAMYGWLVMVLPTHIETVPKPAQYITDKDHKNGTLTRERITANVIVLSDPNGGASPIPWGGDPRALPAGSKPHTHTDPLPYVRKGMWLSGKLIGQLRSGLPPQPGLPPSPLIGRVMKDGPDKTDPWYLAPAGSEDLQRAQYYLDHVASGKFPHPLAP